MDEDLTITTKDTYSSLKAPFHSLSLPQGFLQRTMGNLPLLPGSNPADGEMYSIQHYLIKFVIDLRQVGFLHQ
jgi:hypothetical protein